MTITYMFVLYKICALILGYNDGLDDDPFLPIGQHDTSPLGSTIVVIGHQYQTGTSIRVHAI